MALRSGAEVLVGSCRVSAQVSRGPSGRWLGHCPCRGSPSLPNVEHLKGFELGVRLSRLVIASRGHFHKDTPQQFLTRSFCTMLYAHRFLSRL